MRVLWFTNVLLPDAAAKLGFGQGGGCWMSTLADELQRLPGIELAVACAANVSNRTAFSINGIRHYVVPEPRTDSVKAIHGALRACGDVVCDWNPDLIHYHGTERFYPLLSARGLTAIPAVVSLQGLMGPSSRWGAYFGDSNPLQIARMHWWIEQFLGRGLLWSYLPFRRQAAREREVLRSGRLVLLGRTEWDRAYVRTLDPAAQYRAVGETLRRDFWEQPSWSLDSATRYRVFFSNIGHPRKGADTLLDAACILRSRHPSAHIQLCGTLPERTGYGRYVLRRLKQMNGAVSFLGRLDGAELAKALRSAHVFASASFIDNSPNSVCEAMLCGVPCVCSYTGGTPSLIEHGQTGLFFPPGDPEMLADRVSSIFENDDLARRLGAAARAVAIERHASSKVVCQVIEAYQAAIDLVESGCTA